MLDKTLDIHSMTERCYIIMTMIILWTQLWSVCEYDTDECVNTKMIILWPKETTYNADCSVKTLIILWWKEVYTYNADHSVKTLTDHSVMERDYL